MVLQAYTKEVIREAAILTTSYVAGTVIGQTGKKAEDNNQAILYIDFTIGSLTSAQVKVEFSDDNINYYQETVLSIAAGTSTVSQLEYQFEESGSYRLAIPMKDRYVKVSAKGTGTVTGSSLTIYGIIGTA